MYIIWKWSSLEITVFKMQFLKSGELVYRSKSFLLYNSKNSVLEWEKFVKAVNKTVMVLIHMGVLMRTPVRRATGVPCILSPIHVF